MGNCFSQTSTAPDEHTLVLRPHPNPASDVPVTDDTRPQLGLVALDGDHDATIARGKEPEPDARKTQAAGPSRESEAAPPLQLLLCRFQAGKLRKSVMFSRVNRLPSHLARLGKSGMDEGGRHRARDSGFSRKGEIHQRATTIHCWRPVVLDRRPVHQSAR